MQQLFTWFNGNLQIVKREVVTTCNACHCPIQTDSYAYLRIDNVRICDECVKKLAIAFDVEGTEDGI